IRRVRKAGMIPGAWRLAPGLVILAELSVLEQPFLRRTLRRNPRRSIGDRAMDVGRAIELVVELWLVLLDFGTQRNCAVAEQQTLVRFLVDEVIVDRLRTFGAAHRVDEDFVAKPACTNDVR